MGVHYYTYAYAVDINFQHLVSIAQAGLRCAGAYLIGRRRSQLSHPSS